MAKFSSVNKMVKCGACGKLTHSAVQGTSVGLCAVCLAKAGLENAHADGCHVDAPHAECPDCQAAQTQAACGRVVNPNSIGARLDARGLTHRQVCAHGKHRVDVRCGAELVFSGTTAELSAWLCR